MSYRSAPLWPMLTTCRYVQSSIEQSQQKDQISFKDSQHLFSVSAAISTRSYSIVLVHQQARHCPCTQRHTYIHTYKNVDTYVQQKHYAIICSGRGHTVRATCHSHTACYLYLQYSSTNRTMDVVGLWITIM